MMLLWDIYEVRSKTEPLHGVNFRSRLRRFTIEKGTMCFIENASDDANVMRFALQAGSDASTVIGFIQSLFIEVSVRKVLENIQNPVLSKLKINS